MYWLLAVVAAVAFVVLAIQALNVFQAASHPCKSLTTRRRITYRPLTGYATGRSYYGGDR